MKNETSQGITLVTLTTCLLAGLTTGCTLGSVGSAETVCDQAVDHLANCGITDLPDVGECTATKQQLASRIVNQSCADVSARASFAGSSCDSMWSIFNFSCWGNSSGSQGAGGSGAGGSGLDEPAPGAPQDPCYCDAVCQQYKDCCEGCKEPNPSSSSTCKMKGITVQKGTCIGCMVDVDGFWPSICVGSDTWAPAPGTDTAKLKGCQHYYETCGDTYTKQW